MRLIEHVGLTALVVALLVVLAPSASALECAGIPLNGGCLFTVTGGDTPDPDDGFAVTNAYDVPMWDFVRARDRDALGYPISQRWLDGPFTLQAFQKVILQWDPGKQRMNYYNTLDALANRYPEVELPFVPAHQVLAADRGATFGAVIRNHLALLDQNEAIKARFLSEPDWLNLYGLPIRYEEREVDGHPQGVQMLRTQRTVFVVWNVPTPGTTVGRVNLQNVPDKVKELSNVIIPDHAEHPIRKLAPDLAVAIQALPWVADGISPVERDATQRLEMIGRISPDVFWYLLRDMHLPFTLELARKPIHSTPTDATLEALHLAWAIVGLPWIQDGLTEAERLPFRILADSAFLWPAYVQALLHRPWLHDGISSDEMRVLDHAFGTFYARTLFPGDPHRLGQSMAALVRMPFMETIEGFEARVFRRLNMLDSGIPSAPEAHDFFEGIVSHLTSKGGLTDDHAIVLDTIYRMNQEFVNTITDKRDPTQFDQLLNDPASRGIEIERRWTSLPLAGPTQLIVVREGPSSAEIMNVLEQSVRIVESHMGVKFPTNTVTVIVGDRRGHSVDVPLMFLRRKDVLTGDISPFMRSTFIHETAHFYWHRGGGTEGWISEGGAELVTFWSGYRSEDEIASYLGACPIDRIVDYDSIKYDPEAWGCSYGLGGGLFLDLFEALEEHAFRERFGRYYHMVRATRSTYLEVISGIQIWANSPQTGDYCDFCEGENPGIFFLRRAFLDGASREMALGANRIISRWYYGPQA